MTEQEAFETWWASSNTVGMVTTAEAGWNAALAWLRSQGEPVAVTTQSNIAAMRNGAERGIFARDPVFAAIAPRETDVPLFLTPQPAIPDGYRLVPMEPTPEMLAAFHVAIAAWINEIGGDSEPYQVMLAAAPEPSK